MNGEMDTDFGEGIAYWMNELGIDSAELLDLLRKTTRDQWPCAIPDVSNLAAANQPKDHPVVTKFIRALAMKYPKLLNVKLDGETCRDCGTQMVYTVPQHLLWVGIPWTLPAEASRHICTYALVCGAHTKSGSRCHAGQTQWDGRCKKHTESRPLEVVTAEFRRERAERGRPVSVNEVLNMPMRDVLTLRLVCDELTRT